MKRAEHNYIKANVYLNTNNRLDSVEVFNRHLQHLHSEG